MITVNDIACNGCGDCTDVCPTGAIIFQNNHAFIDQDLCEGCEVCIDACPQGAILAVEKLPVRREVIRIPAMTADHPASQMETNERAAIGDMVLPAIGSMLLWTGRELAPRLANLALGYLDRWTQSSQSAPKDEPGARRNSQVSMSMRGGGGGRRKRRRRKNSRFN